MSDLRSARNFRFGRFLLRPAERQLLEDGDAVPLEARAFDLLTALVERAGRLVTKDELFEEIWPGRVVEDGNLHVQISALRKIVGKGVIATIAGHGYRFSAQVDTIDEPMPPPAGQAHILPRPLASFIGHEDDLVELARDLEQMRLITLTGIGGCGKTRLAIALAERVLAMFPDGTYFVDLAPVAEPARVAAAVAVAVGIRENADRPVEETLIQHFAGCRMLLILDNCEHLIDTCAALVARLLATASALSVLVTSRERLGIAGERVVPVRSLALPPPDSGLDPDALAGFEAVRLFVERAAHAAPGFTLGSGNSAAVVEICRRLDGIPMALELAAARVALLSVEQVRARLDDRFRLLTGSPRAISRHQTLLATLQSSYEFLEVDEQQCFQRLSVFAGGWTLETATAVLGDADEFDTMKVLGRLVDKSLVQVDRAGALGPRYRMLETVRQYAQDRLDDSGTSEDFRERHLAHFLAFARTAQSNLLGAAMRPWLEKIDAELPNLLAAHARCDRTQHGADRGLELATNLRSYWLARGYFAFGQRVYDEALTRKGSDPRSMLRGKALYALGQHYYVRGQLKESLGPTRDALAIAREHGDDEWLVYCLDRLCLASGWLGDTVRAREYCDQELAVASRSGNDRLMSFALTARGGVYRAEGNFDAASDAYERALTLLEGGEDLNNRYNALVNIARVSIARGTLRRALESLAAAICLVAEMGTVYRGHFALEATSRLAAACADWRFAARLQGVSDATVDKMGGTRTWFDDPILTVLREKPRAMLAPEAYTATYDEGRGLALEAALDEAVAWIEDSSSTADGESSAA